MLRGIRIGAFVIAAAATLGVGTSAHAQVARACKGDAAKLCPGTKPGSDEFIQCIRTNREKLSPECKQAAEQMKSNMRQQSQPKQGGSSGQTQPQ